MKTFTRLLALVALAAVPASAQIVTTDVKATTAAIKLWVDPAGADNNNCLFNNKPCKTLNGAYAKIPDNVYHAITIMVAAGTYSSSSTLHDKVIGTGGSIAFVGTGSPTLSGSFSIVNVSGGAAITLTGITVSSPAAGTSLTSVAGVLTFTSPKAPVYFACDEDFASIPAGYWGMNPLPCSVNGIALGMACNVGVSQATPADAGSAWPGGAIIEAIARGAGVVEIDMFNQLGDGGALNPPDAGYHGYCWP
jgi:hypothetical protein